MPKSTERICPACKEVKNYRVDQITCGCARKWSMTVEPLQETSEVKDGSWTISLPKSRIHTLEELVKFFEIDLAVWEVERFVANKWEVGAKGKHGEIVASPLYQVKAFLKKRQEIVDARKEIESLKELAKQEAKKPSVVIRPVRQLLTTSGNMLEINISDHHFGKLAWGTETGHENYDTKLAVKLFNKSLDSLLARTASFDFDEIWFVVGNDLFNTDDVQGRTTGGTQQATDTRYHKTFSVVRTIMVQAIEKLREYAPKVKVLAVSGNHDRLGVWHLGDSLECYFHNYKDVEIDNSPAYYKYHQFGKCMLLFTHGDKGKRSDYPLLMATERPEMFGATRFREAHTGHIHQTRVEEKHGVRVRILASLSPPDAWHSENSFVGNQRMSEAFIWNKDQGLLGTVIYTDLEK